MRLSLIAATLAATSSTFAAADARPMKNSDVFDFEFATDPRVSPDGETIAYVRRSNDIMTDRARQAIWTISVDGERHRPLLSGAMDYSSPRWSPDGDRLAYVAQGANGDPQIHVRFMDDGGALQVTRVREAPGALAWSPDGEMIAFTAFVPDEGVKLATPPDKPEGAEWAEPVKVIDDVIYRSDGAGYAKPGYKQIFVAPASGGSARQLTDGAFNHDGPLAWTGDGEALIFSANRNDDWERDPVESELYKITLADKAIERLTRRDGPDASPVVSPDGSKVAFLGFDDELKGYQGASIYVMDLKGGAPRALAEDLDRSIDAVQWDGDDALIAQYDDRGRSYLARVRLNGERDALVRDVSGLSAGRPYTSGAFSVVDGVIAYTSGRATRPSDIAVKNGSDPARRLTRMNDDILADIEMGEVEEITWESSADGREIQGWLVKPPNFDESRQYPLILEIHGGPFAAYGPHFSAEAQLYAADGNVVLYANPRGSTSYGAEFANLIHHNYPSEDYDDLMSGVDAVIERGYVDEDALFVTGGSGGGVLTAWIVGRTDRFAAAVVAKPVINWISFALTADFYPFFYKYWFDKAPWEDPMSYWRRSPLSLVGEVETPTMLLVGEADYRTPVSETEQFYQALQLRDIDTAMVLVPGAPHGIAGRPSNLIAKVDNILAWFDRYESGGEESRKASARSDRREAARDEGDAQARPNEADETAGGDGEENE